MRRGASRRSRRSRLGTKAADYLTSRSSRPATLARPGGGAGTVGEEDLVGDHHTRPGPGRRQDPGAMARSGVAGHGIDIAEVADQATQGDVLTERDAMDLVVAAGDRSRRAP